MLRLRVHASGVSLTAFALLCFGPSSAEASFFDVYGFNPRALSMAGAQGSVADDFTALYYNPGALTAGDRAVFGFALTLSRNALFIDSARANPTPTPRDPPNATTITVGGHFPLTKPNAARRVALAFAVAVPTGSLLAGRAFDPAIPHWTMYEALPERLVAIVGLGFEPFPGISIGASAQFLASLFGSLDYELDIVAGRFTRKTVSFDIEPRLAPILGLETRLVPGLRAGFSWRGTIQTDVGIPVVLDLTGLARLNVSTDFSVQYTPHELTWSFAYRVPKLELLLAVDLTYALWASAPDPSTTSIIDVTGELLDAAGLGDALDAPAPGQERRVELAYRSVLVPRFGIEKELGPVAVRGGYSVRPSPSPVQTSGANYLDGTSHQLALGASLRLEDPFGLLENPMVFDLSGNWYFHPTRRHPKSSVADPVGDLEAGGSIFVFGLGFRYAYGEVRLETKVDEVSAQGPENGRELR
jgi:hypothetical protein